MYKNSRSCITSTLSSYLPSSLPQHNTTQHAGTAYYDFNYTSYYIRPVGTVAREEMMKSKLPNSVLRRVWVLSDIDQDGMLDRDEFAVAMFLIDHKLSGNDIPEFLPSRLVPPSKKSLCKSGRGGGGGGGGGNVQASLSSGRHHPSSSLGGGSGGDSPYRGRPMTGNLDDEDDLSHFVDSGH